MLSIPKKKKARREAPTKAAESIESETQSEPSTAAEELKRKTRAAPPWKSSSSTTASIQDQSKPRGGRDRGTDKDELRARRTKSNSSSSSSSSSSRNQNNQEARKPETSRRQHQKQEEEQQQQQQQQKEEERDLRQRQQEEREQPVQEQERLLLKQKQDEDALIEEELSNDPEKRKWLEEMAEYNRRLREYEEYQRREAEAEAEAANQDRFVEDSRRDDTVDMDDGMHNRDAWSYSGPGGDGYEYREGTDVYQDEYQQRGHRSNDPHQRSGDYRQDFDTAMEGEYRGGYHAGRGAERQRFRDPLQEDWSGPSGASDGERRRYADESVAGAYAREPALREDSRHAGAEPMWEGQDPRRLPSDQRREHARDFDRDWDGAGRGAGERDFPRDKPPRGRGPHPDDRSRPDRGGIGGPGYASRPLSPLGSRTSSDGHVMGPSYRDPRDEPRSGDSYRGDYRGGDERGASHRGGPPLHRDERRSMMVRGVSGDSSTDDREKFGPAHSKMVRGADPRDTTADQRKWARSNSDISERRINGRSPIQSQPPNGSMSDKRGNGTGREALLDRSLSSPRGGGGNRQQRRKRPDPMDSEADGYKNKEQQRNEGRAIADTKATAVDSKRKARKQEEMEEGEVEEGEVLE